MRLKKTLAFALAIAMVFGLVSMAAAAPAAHGTAFADVAADHPRAKQITALGALGIALGDGGLGSNFNPGATLTRAEFATFAVRLAGLEPSAKALAGYPPSFNDAADIPEWAYGYINVAQSEGIVIGDDQGNFNAGAEVTYAEALTMLVRITGWKDTVTGTVWPMNYMTRAIALGISKGVDLTANAPITRGDMAALLFSAGNTHKPEMQDGKWTGKEIADSAPFFDTTKKGLVAEYNAAAGTVVIGGHGTLELADDVYLSGVASLAATVGRQVTALLNGDEEVVFIAVDAAGDQITGVYKGTKTGDGADYIELRDGTLVRYDDAKTQVTVNGGLSKLFPGDMVAGDPVAITTEKGVAASVVVTRLSGDLLLAKDAQPKKDSDVASYDHVEINGAKVRVSRASITLNGEPVAFSELKKNDVVRVALVGGTSVAAVADSMHAHRIEATRNKLEGTITDHEISFDDKYRVTYTVKLADGTEKDLAWSAGFDTFAEATTAVLSGKGTFFLNAAGKAAFFDGVQDLTPSVAKLVSVIDANSGYFDVLGVIKKLEVAGLNAQNLHALGTLNPAATSWTPLTTYGTHYAQEGVVVSVDAENNTITYKQTVGSNTTYGIINNAIVYGQQFAGKVAATGYLGVEGLKADDKIRFQAGQSHVLKVTTTAAPALSAEIAPAEVDKDSDEEVTITVTGSPVSLTVAAGITVSVGGQNVNMGSATVTGNSITFDLDETTMTNTAGNKPVIVSFIYAGETWTATTTLVVN